MQKLRGLKGRAADSPDTRVQEVRTSALEIGYSHLGEGVLTVEDPEKAEKVVSTKR